MSRELIKKKADQIMDRIALGLVSFERHGDRTKPLVFMSKDIMDILALSENILLCKDQSRELRFFGCKVKMVVGENVLSVGYDLLEGEKIDERAD
ncbi:MAG: hypothetical protein J6S14_12860 [Clostridia bacterium]|nr:hypothetical protein [Clostridia bacterium]